MRAAVAEADHHVAGVAALGDVPVARLGGRAALEADAAVKVLSAAAIHLADAVLLGAERRAGPAVAAVADRVPGPRRQGAAAAVRPVRGAVAEALREHDDVRGAVGHGRVDRLLAAGLEDQDVARVATGREAVALDVLGLHLSAAAVHAGVDGRRVARAEVRLDDAAADVHRVGVNAVDVRGLVDRVLFDVGQQVEEDGAVAPVGGGRVGAAGVRVGLPGRHPFDRRHLAVNAVVVVDGDAHLVEIVAALRCARGLADFLDGGDEQADQDGDDRDHHQQLDQREGPSPDEPSQSRHGTPPRKRKKESGAPRNKPVGTPTIARFRARGRQPWHAQLVPHQAAGTPP